MPFLDPHEVETPMPVGAWTHYIQHIFLLPDEPLAVVVPPALRVLHREGLAVEHDRDHLQHIFPTKHEAGQQMLLN